MKFHGRTVKGWVLGPAADPPEGRLLPVQRVLGHIRFFDERRLELLRWVSERYIAPLSTVIERSHPPRVASEEKGFAAAPVTGRDPADPLVPGEVSWVRPLPGDEGGACVRGVRGCLEGGGRAVVLVPEADPMPATAWAVLDAFGDRAVWFAGGSERERYRTWLRILAGEFDVVVGTRPAVFAPIPGVGLVWVSREVHPGHREDRSPYYHVRDVAVARARIEGAACSIAALCPSVETATAIETGAVRVSRPPRGQERRAAPLVETVPPEGEDRSARLAALLRAAESAALIVSRSGYGVARVCKRCTQPARCAACEGPIVFERSRAVCRVCGAPGRCANCGAASFGVERGGVERVAEWAVRPAVVPVHIARAGDDDDEGTEADGAGSTDSGRGAETAYVDTGQVLVGTAAAVKDAGPVRLDVVGLLDPDRALARPGLRAGEQALATWMEAAVWAGPRAEGGRVLVQTRNPGHPAVQALIRWEPLPFLLGDGRRRAEAGFPPGCPVFRLALREPGEGPGSESILRAAGAHSVLATAAMGLTLCLVAVRPESLSAFRLEILRLAVDGVVDRVEAEPHL